MRRRESAVDERSTAGRTAYWPKKEAGLKAADWWFVVANDDTMSFCVDFFAQKQRQVLSKQLQLNLQRCCCCPPSAVVGSSVCVRAPACNVCCWHAARAQPPGHFLVGRIKHFIGCYCRRRRRRCAWWTTSARVHAASNTAADTSILRQCCRRHSPDSAWDRPRAWPRQLVKPSVALRCGQAGGWPPRD